MAAWDPFGVLEASSTSTAATAGPGNGGKNRPSKKDLDLIADTLFQETCDQKPWQKTPDPRPDLSWYEPSCTLQAWNHTDVKLELGQGIAYVTLNKPKVGNVLSSSILLGLCDAVVGLHARPDIRCVVFSGAGALFCGGADPKSDGNFATHKFSPKGEKALMKLKERAVKAGALKDMDSNPGLLLQAKMWQAMTQLPQFTIALVNGSAMGDGLGCVACVDMVISVKSAYYSLPEVKDGRVQCLITPYIVAKAGMGYAKYMLGSGMNLTTDDMVLAGLVNEVVDSVEDGQKKITDICEVLTACGPRSVEAAKQLVVGVGGQPITEGVMFFTASLLAMVTVSYEAKVGMVCLQTKQPKPWEEKPIMTLH